MGNQPGNQPAVMSFCCSTCRTVDAIIKDQVTRMLFRKNIVSTRTLLQLTVAVAFLVGGVVSAVAAGTTNAPLLVPYTVTTLAGNPQFAAGTTSLLAGYFGEGVLATPSATKPGATLNGAFSEAVDSAGNVYIADSGNYIIREVNAQTGLITTIAGVIPKGCSGVSCSLKVSGCADGVPAYGNPLGTGLKGIAVDNYDNVYFLDGNTNSVSVIYRGGSRVATFIALEDPAGVAASGGVAQPGYVYHVAGTMNLGTCSSTSGNTDNALAFGGTTLHGASQISLDSAGNIYIADVSNSTVRVINTQLTPQTFFQYTVQPGFLRSITNCNALLTTPCPTATTTTVANTGINGPVNAIVYNSQYKIAQADAYGNIYQLNGTGGGTGPPGIYSATTYAGGAPLTNLLIAEAPNLAGYYGPTVGNAPAELNAQGLPTYGNSYMTMSNPQVSSALPGSFPDVLVTTNSSFNIRPSHLMSDNFGSLWYMDNHYPEFSRIDQYTSLATDMIGSTGMRATANVAGISGVTINGNPVNYLAPASFSNPWYCVYGSAAHPWQAGPITYDPEGDGCPSVLGRLSGNYTAQSDGLGNIIMGDGGESLVRLLSLGNAFPATTVGTATPVTQPIQVHFSLGNPPALGAGVNDSSASGFYAAGNTFKITGLTSDFTLDQTDAEFPLGSLLTATVNAYGNNQNTTAFGTVSGLPTCTEMGQYPTATADTDVDCLAYVTFTPQGPGLRQAQLQVTTANGSVYNFPLSGVGLGGQLAIDGGSSLPIAATGLGKTAGVAVTSGGTVYIADPANNRIVVEPAGGGTQTTLALTFPACPTPAVLGVQCGVTPTTLSGPMGVAVDIAGNVYISDTGNNRILKVNPNTNVATLLGNNLWISGAAAGVQSSTAPGSAVTATTAPPQYQFKAPQGLAVDLFNNVYVADTGNGVVVEIPSNIALGGATPLLQYPNAPTFINPVAVATDSTGNIYVADTKNATGQIVKLPPGGGDLVTLPTSQFPGVAGSSLLSPNGVAVDGAGNVYVSDSSANTVMEFPSGSGAHAVPFALNFPNLNTPAGLALDAYGNLYVADSGNKQILWDNRLTPNLNFGTVPQDQSSVATIPLTITNIGTQPVTLLSPFTSTPSILDFTIANNSCAAGLLLGGVTCSISVSFNPTSDTSRSGITVNINGTGNTSQQITLQANGEQPLAKVVLTAGYSSGTVPAAGLTATITATVTQPNIPGDTPTGTVAFSYTILGDGTTGTATGTLSGSGGVATATFALPTLLSGRRYTINAVYTSTDPLDTGTTASPLVLYVPGVPVTVTAGSVTFQYGTTPPKITGTVTGITDPAVTYTFTSAASATTAIGTYPIIVVFSGGTYLNYGFPAAVTSTGGPAIVTETAAPLSYSIPNFTAAFGAPDLSYGALGVVTGALNGDTFSATFTNPASSVLNVGTYTIQPTVTGAHVGDYTVTAKSSTLTVTQAASNISVAAAQTSVLNTTVGVSSATILLTAGTSVPAGKGTPSGTITVSDTFTPILLTAPGPGAAQAPVLTTLPLVGGSVTYIPTSTTPGTHIYSFAYSGDSNFQCSVVGQAATSSCPTTGTTATKLLIDYPDFTLSSSTGVVNIIPGIIPSGNGLPPAANQSSAATESAVITVAGVLGFNGNVALTCTTQNPSYITCAMTPPTVALTASGTGASSASVFSVQTPATLPLGFFNSAQVRTSATRTALAFLPFGVLAFCVRRRRRLSKMLWMLIAIAAVGAGMQGCGGNQVDFYTPVPTGPQTVTITATYTAPPGSTIPSETRTFIVPITIN